MASDLPFMFWFFPFAASRVLIWDSFIYDFHKVEGDSLKQNSSFV